jgi:hypothetical protein
VLRRYFEPFLMSVRYVGSWTVYWPLSATVAEIDRQARDASFSYTRIVPGHCPMSQSCTVGLINAVVDSVLWPSTLLARRYSNTIVRNPSNFKGIQCLTFPKYEVVLEQRQAARCASNVPGFSQHTWRFFDAEETVCDFRQSVFCWWMISRCLDNS